MKKIVFLTALLPMSSFAEVALETQKVTANKITNSQVSNSTIISREQIELLQATNLSEILTSLPGFQVTQQGGNANTQSFSMNGFKSDQILILLNGQRFGSATLGSTTFNTIPANIIQSIEIVSNARSAIYGSDAMGGVINIITNDDIASNNIKVALGNHKTSQFSTNLNKKIGKLSLNFSGFTEATQGFDVKESGDNDHDGSERHALGLNIGYQVNSENKVSVSSQSNRGSYDYDSSFGGDQSDYQQQVTSLGWDYAADIYGISAKYGESFDKSWNYGNGTSRSNAGIFATESKTIDLTARAKVNDAHTLLVVTDYREDDISKSDSQYDKKKGDFNGLGLSHNFSSKSVNTEIGVRRDNSSLFDENYSYSASAEWFALEQLSIIAGINTGFKTPSFNDLYYPLNFGYAGNKDVEPEKSLNRRLAVQYDHGQSTYNASYQYSHIEDLIQWQDDGSGINRPTNVSKALLRNATISWDYSLLNNFSSQISYEWNDAINLETHNLLERQSSRIAKLNVNYNHNTFSLGSNIRHLSDSYDDANNDDMLAAYTVIDAYGSIVIAHNFTIGVRFNNLTNKEYQTAKGYPAQERTYLVSGTFTF
tara:strand:- start:54 stop:1844 length:1791 start_codon:yes stop_codon:yes gene_type:complete